MSNVYHISDLHLGHRKILHYSPERGGTNVIEHSEWIVEQWNSVINKKDIVWVHGDVCFDREHMKYLGMLNGKKRMIWGNHDIFKLEEYQEYFEEVVGFRKRNKLWLSHSPVHPDELRGCINVHGHVHANSVRLNQIDNLYDPRYFNVCVEACNGIPVHVNEIKQRQEEVFGVLNGKTRAT